MKSIIRISPIFALLFMLTHVHADEFQDGVDAYAKGDYKIAINKFIDLAENGDPGAQSNLGLMYEKGNGVQHDYKQAVKWFRKAVEKDDEYAQYNLARLYASGKGVKQDSSAAIKLYRLSAEQGFAPAQSNLGVLYAQGVGVIKNDVEALKWFNLAATGGNDVGRKKFILKKRMTSEQITESEKQSKHWIDRHQN